MSVVIFVRNYFIFVQFVGLSIYNKNLFGARCIVFRLGIIGMMKRIIGSMIRIIGKIVEKTRIE